MLFTDPPYSSGGAFLGDRAQSAATKYVVDGDQMRYGDFGGDSRDQRAYLAWSSLWLSSCFRALRSGSIACVWTDWRQIGVTIDAVQCGGFIYRGIVPWDKTECARPMMGRYRGQCEYVVWSSRGSLGSQHDRTRRVHPGLWRYPVSKLDKTHIAQKPLEVCAEMLEIAPAGGTILDPFAGSGTTLEAAYITGRRAVGMESCPDNFAKIVERVDRLFTEKRWRRKPTTRT